MTDLLAEVANWKIDAIADDNERYFYFRPSTSAVFEAGKCIVVGGRGTGKSALAQYLQKTLRRKEVSLNVSIATAIADGLLSGGRPSQESNPEGFAKNKVALKAYILESIRNSIIDRQRMHYPRFLRVLLEAKDRVIPRGGLSLSLGPVKGEVEASEGRDKRQRPSERLTRSKNFIRDKLANEWTICCIIDELDADFAGRLTQEDLSTLSALIEACTELSRDRELSGQQIAVFVREDIFDRLPQKSVKRAEYVTTLAWTKEELKQLIAFRTMRADDRDSPADTFNPARCDVELQRIFDAGQIQDGAERIDKFEYIARRTLGRPRDYVSFLRICARIAIENEEGHISLLSLGQAREAWIEYLWADLRDEFSPFVVDAERLLSAIRRRSAVVGERFREPDLLTDLEVSGYCEDPAVARKDLTYVLNRLRYMRAIAVPKGIVDDGQTFVLSVALS